MWQKTCPRMNFGATIALLGLVVGVGLAASGQLVKAWGAQSSTNAPMKLDVRPLARSYRVGDAVKLEITLRDYRGNAVPARQKTYVTILINYPTGNRTSARITFERGDNARPYQFVATVQGLYQIVAREAENHLREGSYTIFVGRARTQSTPHPEFQERLLESDAWLSENERRTSLDAIVIKLTAAKFPQEPGIDAQNQAIESPELMLQVSEGEREYLADGRDEARCQVFYMSPDGSGAPKDIKVWLSSSNGDLAPMPLIIRRGESWGVAKLRSNWPVDAHVKTVSSSPHFPFVGLTEYTIKFVPPIYGISATLPKKIPLVDNGTMVAELYGPDNEPITTTRKRTVTFTSNSSKVYFPSAQKDIEPGGSTVSILLVPLELGKTEVTVSTPEYPTKTYTVNVTGLAVILLCLSGGVIGGLCAYNAFKGSLVWRIVLGIVGGAVLTWLYVYGLLPHTTSYFAHSLVSALFVSIVGGYLGLQVLNLAAKLLGSLGEPQKS